MKMIGDWNKKVLFSMIAEYILIDFKYYLNSQKEKDEKFIIEMLDELLKTKEIPNKTVFDKIFQRSKENEKTNTKDASLNILLGICYQTGMNHPQPRDENEGSRLIHSGIQLGNTYGNVLKEFYKLNKPVDTAKIAVDLEVIDLKATTESSANKVNADKISDIQKVAEIKTPFAMTLYGQYLIEGTKNSTEDEKKLGLELLKQAAKLNCVPACNVLFMYYDDLSNTQSSLEDYKQNRKLARDYVNKAKDLGCLMADGYISQACQDPERQIKLQKSAAENGNAAHASNLGLKYLYGIQVKKDIEKAIQYLKLAASQYEGESLFMLANLYAETAISHAIQKSQVLLFGGHPLEFSTIIKESRIYPNVKFALECLEHGVDIKDGPEQWLMGILYLTGTEVEKNQKKAVELIAASVVGHNDYHFRMQGGKGAIASINALLGKCYEQGIGVTEDKQEAEKYYSTALNNAPEHKDINYLVGKFYIRYYRESLLPLAFKEAAIEFASRILEKGMRCLVKAKQLSQPMAMTRLAKYDLRNMYVDVRRQIENPNHKAYPTDLFALAMILGSLEARYWLCYLLSGSPIELKVKELFDRVGIILSPKEFIELNFNQLKMQSESQNIQAIHLVGRCYEGGYGIPQHVDIAFEYYKKSAAEGWEASKRKIKMIQAAVKPIYQTILNALNEHQIASPTVLSIIITWYAMEANFMPLYKAISAAVVSQPTASASASASAAAPQAIVSATEAAEDAKDSHERYSI